MCSFNFLQLKQALYLPYLLPSPWLGVRRIMGESRIATEPQEVTYLAATLAEEKCGSLPF